MINEYTVDRENLNKVIVQSLENTKPAHSLELNVTLSFTFKDKKRMKQLNKKKMEFIFPFKHRSGRAYKVYSIFHDPEAQIKMQSDLNIEEFKNLKKKHFDMLLCSHLSVHRLGAYAKLLGVKGLMPSANSNTVFTSDTVMMDYHQQLVSGHYRKVVVNIDVKRSTLNLHTAFASCTLSAEHATDNLEQIVKFINNELIDKISCDKISIEDMYIKTTRGNSYHV